MPPFITGISSLNFTSKFRFGKQGLLTIIAGGYIGAPNYHPNLTSKYDSVLSSYTTLTTMTAERTMGCTGTIPNELYVIGGRFYSSSPTTWTNRVEKLTLSSNSWSTKTSYPVNIDQSRSGTIDDNVYVFGGFTGSGSYFSASTNQYNTTSNSWSSKSSLPSGTYVAQGSALGGYVWNLKGTTSTVGANDYVSHAVQYNPSVNSWTNKASDGTYKSGQGVHMNDFDQRLYVVGGWSGDNSSAFGFNNNISATRIYNITTNSWSSASTLPSGGTRGINGAGNEENNGVLVGGYTSSYINKTQVYNYISNAWSTGTNYSYNIGFVDAGSV